MNDKRAINSLTNEQLAESWKALFSGKNDSFDYLSLTPVQLQSLPVKYNSVVTFAVGMFSEEDYVTISEIQLKGNSKLEFLHMLIRESTRRNSLENVVNITGYLPRAQIDKKITVNRPRDVGLKSAHFLTLRAGDVAMYDLAVDALGAPMRSSFVLQPDVARQFGIPRGRTNEIKLPNDTQALMVGYLGSGPVKSLATWGIG